MTGVPGGGPEPAKGTTTNAGRSAAPPGPPHGPKARHRPERRPPGKGQDRNPEHLIAVNRKASHARGALRPRSPTAARARFEYSLIAMTWNRSGVSATRMRAQITLFGVTIAFVPADQDCRAERRSARCYPAGLASLVR